MSLFRVRAAFALAVLLLASGCASLGPAQRAAGARVAIDARATAIDCNAADACAQASPLRELDARAFAESTPSTPRHYVRILDEGPDALVARLAMIRQRKPILSQRARDRLHNAAVAGAVLMLMLSVIGAAST